MRISKSEAATLRTMVRRVDWFMLAGSRTLNRVFDGTNRETTHHGAWGTTHGGA